MNTATALPSQLPQVICDKAIAHTGEPARADLAAGWICGKVHIRKPTQAQAAAVFGVTTTAVKHALDRAGVPHRPYRKGKPTTTTTMVTGLSSRLAGDLTVDQLRELAASIEATAVKPNGSAAHT